MNARWISVGVAAIVAGLIVVFALVRGSGSTGPASLASGSKVPPRSDGSGASAPEATDQGERIRDQLAQILERLDPDERESVEQYHDTLEDKLFYARIYDVQRTFSGDDRELRFIHEVVDAYSITPPGAPEPEGFDEVNKVVAGTTALVWTWHHRGPIPTQVEFMKRTGVRLSEDQDETLRMAAGLTLKLLDERGVELGEKERRAYDRLMDQPVIAGLVERQWEFLHDPEFSP